MRLVRFLVCVAGLAATCGAAQVRWVNPNPATAPSARKYAVMVWDSVRERVVLFGGQEDLSTYHNDTWEWDGTRWIELHPAHRPPAREDHMMAFDAGRGRVVLFGGHDVNVTFFNDTWEWDGVDWHQRTPATAPPRRAYGAMAYDPIRRHCVIFGGVDSSIREVAATWTWDGSNWQARSVADPGPRTQHAMCWNPARQRITLYGGTRSSAGWFADQWEWNGSSWLEVTTVPPGPALNDLRMVYDTVRDRLVLWGGQLQPAGVAWELDAGSWLQRTVPAPLPADRQAHTMAFDEARGETVMFGGYDGNDRFGDTWVYRSIAPAHASSFGHNCGEPATSPVLALAPGQRPWLGDTLTFAVAGPSLPRPAMLAIGVSRQAWLGMVLPLDLQSLGMSGCELLTSTDVLLAMPPATSGARLSLPVPSDTGLLGARAYFQALVPEQNANPAGLLTSGGLQLTFGAR